MWFGPTTRVGITSHSPLVPFYDARHGDWIAKVLDAAGDGALLTIALMGVRLQGTFFGVIWVIATVHVLNSRSIIICSGVPRWSLMR